MKIEQVAGYTGNNGNGAFFVVGDGDGKRVQIVFKDTRIHKNINKVITRAVEFAKYKKYRDVYIDDNKDGIFSIFNIPNLATKGYICNDGTYMPEEVNQEVTIAGNYITIGNDTNVLPELKNQFIFNYQRRQ